MKVVILTSTHPPFDVRVFYKIARTIAEAGHDVTYLLMYNGEGESDSEVDFITIPRPKNRFMRVIKGRKLLKPALKLDADVYIINDTEILYLGKKLAKKGKKVVHDAMEPYPDFLAEKSWIPGFLKPLARRMATSAERRGCEKADGILVAMQENVDRLSCCNTPILTLHNYPRVEDILNDLPPKENSVIYVGGIMWARMGKEIVSMAKGFAPGGILDGWKLNVVGPIHYRGYGAECMDIAEKHRGKDYFNMSGKLEKYSNVLKMMTSARFGLSLVRPTRNYSQIVSSKVFDYMAKGTIPIATWLPSYKGLITEEAGPIFIQSGDEGKVPQIIADLAERPQEMRERALTCMRSVREKYNWEAEGRELPSFLENIVK